MYTGHYVYSSWQGECPKLHIQTEKKIKVHYLNACTTLFLLLTMHQLLLSCKQKAIRVVNEQKGIIALYV